MASRKKALETVEEVDTAVDDLLATMGLGPDAAMPNDDDESAFQGPATRRSAEPAVNAKQEVAPSAGLDALWGTPPRKK